jgi:hypothetical protein
VNSADHGGVLGTPGAIDELSIVDRSASTP